MQFIDCIRHKKYLLLTIVKKHANSTLEQKIVYRCYRYSYLAKVDDKEGIRHKGFGVIKIPTKI
ncbi:hypothetical protein ABNIH10_15061 [Acinetobacter baumannii ABNIH10]|nr:hypothetical protein ABNIH10_15061 [Acinetobacter baumannii ABNIH10]